MPKHHTGHMAPDCRENVAHYRGFRHGTGSTPDDAGAQSGGGHAAVSPDTVGAAFEHPETARRYLQGNRR